MQMTISEDVCFHSLKRISYCLMYDGLKTKKIRTVEAGQSLYGREVINAEVLLFYPRSGLFRGLKLVIGLSYQVESWCMID